MKPVPQVSRCVVLCSMDTMWDKMSHSVVSITKPCHRVHLHMELWLVLQSVMVTHRCITMDM